LTLVRAKLGSGVVLIVIEVVRTPPLSDRETVKSPGLIAIAGLCPTVNIVKVRTSVDNVERNFFMDEKLQGPRGWKKIECG